MFNRTVTLARLSKGDQFVARVGVHLQTLAHCGETEDGQVLASYKSSGSAARYHVFSPVTEVKIDSSTELATLWRVSDNGGGLAVERDDDMVRACGLSAYSDDHAAVGALRRWVECEDEVATDDLGAAHGLDKAGPAHWSAGDAFLGSALVSLMLNLPAFQSGDNAADRARAWDVLMGPEKAESPEPEEAQPRKPAGSTPPIAPEGWDLVWSGTGPRPAKDQQPDDVLLYRSLNEGCWVGGACDGRLRTNMLPEEFKTSDPRTLQRHVKGDSHNITYALYRKREEARPWHETIAPAGWDLVEHGRGGDFDRSKVQVGDVVVHGYMSREARPLGGEVTGRSDYGAIDVEYASAAWGSTELNQYQGVMAGSAPSLYYAAYRKTAQPVRLDTLKLGDKLRLTTKDDEVFTVVEIRSGLLSTDTGKSWSTYLVQGAEGSTLNLNGVNPVIVVAD